MRFEVYLYTIGAYKAREISHPESLGAFPRAIRWAGTFSRDVNDKVCDKGTDNQQVSYPCLQYASFQDASSRPHKYL